MFKCRKKKKDVSLLNEFFWEKLRELDQRLSALCDLLGVVIDWRGDKIIPGGYTARKIDRRKKDAD